MGGVGGRREPEGAGETNLYFLSLDFFVSVGIAQIATALESSVRAHLVVVDYPRPINADYFTYFDSVHHLVKTSSAVPFVISGGRAITSIMSF